MMERRPRVWRKEKLADSGKPDRKMPLSTMEKLRGGMKRSSPSSATAAVIVAAAVATAETSFSGGGDSLTSRGVLHISVPTRSFWRRWRSTFIISDFSLFSMRRTEKKEQEYLYIYIYKYIESIERKRIGIGEDIPLLLAFLLLLLLLLVLAALGKKLFLSLFFLLE